MSSSDEPADQGGDITASGATPLDPDENAALLPTHIRTREELNAWEALNIAAAEEWIASWRRRRDVLTTSFLAELHRRMFGETWAWAGRYRTSMKRVSSYPAFEVPRLMADLVADVRAQRASSDDTPAALDEIALRFHHQMVRIHPWPNGNGRHARLATDLLLESWGRPRFTWGHAALSARTGAERGTYIAALRAADGGDVAPLRAFVRNGP